MIKILFVCHGNICRSPMAEFVMKDLLKKHNGGALATNFEIESAATSTEEIGNPVYPPAQRILNAHGIDCKGKSARQMTAQDYEYYDYIILMDKNNLRNLRLILPNGDKSNKISLLMDWTGKSRDVKDPWYTDRKSVV